MIVIYTIPILVPLALEGMNLVIVSIQGNIQINILYLLLVEFMTLFILTLYNDKQMQIIHGKKEMEDEREEEDMAMESIFIQ